MSQPSIPRSDIAKYLSAYSDFRILAHFRAFVDRFSKDQTRVPCRHAQNNSTPLTQNLYHNSTLLTTRNYSWHQVLPISIVKAFLINGLKETPIFWHLLPD